MQLVSNQKCNIIYKHHLQCYSQKSRKGMLQRTVAMVTEHTVMDNIQERREHWNVYILRRGSKQDHRVCVIYDKPFCCAGAFSGAFEEISVVCTAKNVTEAWNTNGRYIHTNKRPGLLRWNWRRHAYGFRFQICIFIDLMFSIVMYCYACRSFLATIITTHWKATIMHVEKRMHEYTLELETLTCPGRHLSPAVCSLHWLGKWYRTEWGCLEPPGSPETARRERVTRSLLSSGCQFGLLGVDPGYKPTGLKFIVRSWIGIIRPAQTRTKPCECEIQQILTCWV